MTETTISTVNTQTHNEETEKSLSLKDFSERTKRTVKAPLFILFAEYLGFVSKIITWAEDWCDGNQPSSYKVNAIETDAICLLNKVKKQYTEEELIDWYDEFYDVILLEYDINLKNLEIKQNLADD